MRLLERRNLNSWELANIQSNHLIAQLYFCLYTTSTHNMIAVQSINHGGRKSARNVLHCYALIWSNGWHIIDYRGSVHTLSFSRMQQTVPELEGATVVILYSMKAFSRIVFDSSTALSEPNEATKEHSIINRAYGAFMGVGHPNQHLPPWCRPEGNWKERIRAWLEAELLQLPIQMTVPAHHP